MLAHIPDRLPMCTCWNNRSLRRIGEYPIYVIYSREKEEPGEAGVEKRRVGERVEDYVASSCSVQGPDSAAGTVAVAVRARLFAAAAVGNFGAGSGTVRYCRKQTWLHRPTLLACPATQQTGVPYTVATV